MKSINASSVTPWISYGFGFVGNRLVIPYMNEAQFLVEEGATPEQVDRVLTEFGMAMGMLAVFDMAGVDVGVVVDGGGHLLVSPGRGRDPVGVRAGGA